MVSHLRTPIPNCFIYLMWAYFLTDSELSCLAMLAKPYLITVPTLFTPLHVKRCTSGAWDYL